MDGGRYECVCVFVVWEGDRSMDGGRCVCVCVCV